jgi:small subunit ribosomal protein S20
MANTLSAKKRIRQNETHRRRNRWRLRAMRLAIRDLREKIHQGTNEEADAALRTACQIIDKTAGKGVIHKNNAARKKSRLTARVKAKKAGA